MCIVFDIYRKLLIVRPRLVGSDERSRLLFQLALSGLCQKQVKHYKLPGQENDRQQSLSQESVRCSAFNRAKS